MSVALVCFDSDGWHLVPEHLVEGVDAHISTGRPVGRFLTAVLSNDLHEAVSSGDDKSLAGLLNLVQFLYCEAPSECWGSRERVEAWRARGGLRGRESAPNPSSAT